MAEPTRIPLVESVEARSATSDKDGIATNIFFDKDNKGTSYAVKRPGISALLSGSGLGQGVFSYNDQIFNFTDVNVIATQLPAYIGGVNVAWSGSLFVVVPYQLGTTYYTSPDGIVWTTRTLPSSAFWAGVAWNGSVFCIVSSSTNNTLSTGSNKALTSPDGITWTARTLPSTSTWYKVIWTGVNFVCASNGQGGVTTTKVATSPDGITWTARVFIDSRNWSGLCYGNGVIIACSNGLNTSQYGKSTDHGVTWTSVTHGLDNPTSQLPMAWAGDRFVVMQSTGAAGSAYSTNGAVWTRNVGVTTSAVPGTLNYNNFTLVAVEIATGSEISNLHIYTSADKGVSNWTTVTSTIKGFIRLDSMITIGSSFFAIGGTDNNTTSTAYIISIGPFPIVQTF